MNGFRHNTFPDTAVFCTLYRYIFTYFRKLLIKPPTKENANYDQYISTLKTLLLPITTANSRIHQSNCTFTDHRINTRHPKKFNVLIGKFELIKSASTIVILTKDSTQLQAIHHISRTTLTTYLATPHIWST